MVERTVLESGYMGVSESKMVGNIFLYKVCSYICLHVFMIVTAKSFSARTRLPFSNYRVGQSM